MATTPDRPDADDAPAALFILPRSQRYGFYALVLLALFIIGLAAVAWVAALRVNTPAHPLSITACTPETYDTPVGTQQGPPQDECERWFQPRGDSWPADEPIRVVGQVCNDGDVPVAYQVSVAFVPVAAGEGGGRFNVIDTPITYDPGCQEAYDFAFQFPPSLTAGSASGADLGQWRIVGTARPVDRTRYSEYQWDAAATTNYLTP